jgi:hypothetical protein
VSLLPSRYHDSFAGGLDPTVMQLISYFRLALRGACSLLSIVTLSGLTATSEDRAGFDQESDRARIEGAGAGGGEGEESRCLGDRGLCGQLARHCSSAP